MDKLVDENLQGVVTLQTTSPDYLSLLRKKMDNRDRRQSLPLLCIRLYKIAKRVEVVGKLRHRQ
jgi:hypothetical protein